MAELNRRVTGAALRTGVARGRRRRPAACRTGGCGCGWGHRFRPLLERSVTADVGPHLLEVRHDGASHRLCPLFHCEGMRGAKAEGRLRGKKPKLNRREEAHLVSLVHSGDYSTAETPSKPRPSDTSATESGSASGTASSAERGWDRTHPCRPDPDRRPTAVVAWICPRGTPPCAASEHGTEGSGRGEDDGDV